MRNFPKIIARTIMTEQAKRVSIPKNGVDYRGKIVLAPMVRSGELPSRLLALHYGADLVWGPETVDRSLIGTTRKVNNLLQTIDFTRLPSNGSKIPRENQKESIIFRLHPEKESKRLIFQIGTSDPARAVEAARIVARDVAGIDVNAGCPKPFSTSGGMGAALLQTPEKLCSILRALVQEITTEFEIGISVKIRLLDTVESTLSLVKDLCETGITGLTVHCRTTPMRPRERAIRDQLSMIADVCREKGVACIMNGDVQNRAQAEILIAEYGVDGAMIASAAEANSSCFRSEIEGGLAPWNEVVKQYLKICLQFENRFGNTKYLLNHLIPGKQSVYREMTASKCYQQVCSYLGLSDFESRAKQVDENLGINHEGREQVKRLKQQNKSAMAASGHKGIVQSLEVKGKRNLSERGNQNQTNADLKV
ncbi:tRNA-dihydrouridine synthase [Erysiphe neolycopersici]|uniref:tRNA-dihydrouridine synthase n=1 Tax=Erysiphe neolycopersici TaxID=212602 RepID=A0A420HII2_9PEZI|nr:tRNA-dihydrouridine synthase [Erysiphe neolycopersici]